MTSTTPRPGGPADASRRRTHDERMWRFGVVLGAAAIVLGFVGLLGVVWVIAQTDTGMMCQPPSTPDDPWVCAIYEVPFVMVLAAAVGFVAAVVLTLASFGWRSG